MQPALAESWEISDDGLTYTFHIREGAKWFTSEGEEYADVTANDFVAGFHHMLDAQAGLEWLVEGRGQGRYRLPDDGGSLDDVGYEAADDYTLVVTLEGNIPYFMTMLTYSCFLPICEDWYLSHGGVYGIDEYRCRFRRHQHLHLRQEHRRGLPGLLRTLPAAEADPDSEIVVVKNPDYYNADKVTLNSITWIYDAGENPTQTYNDVVNNVYPGITLSTANGTLELAKADGNFDKYAYVTDTTSTSYFGGLNLNRGTFALESGAVASPQTEQQKIDTHTALMNKNFRKAFVKAFDKETVQRCVPRRRPGSDQPAQHVHPSRVRAAVR